MGSETEVEIDELQPVCFHFRDKGDCKFGDQCRFSHTAAPAHGTTPSKNSNDKNNKSADALVLKARTFAPIIQAYGDRGEFRKACALWQKVKQLPLNRTEREYEVMFRACSQHPVRAQHISSSFSWSAEDDTTPADRLAFLERLLDEFSNGWERANVILYFGHLFCHFDFVDSLFSGCSMPLIINLSADVYSYCAARCVCFVRMPLFLALCRLAHGQTNGIGASRGIPTPN